MILRSVGPSPFGRKVRISASVLGLDNEITIEAADTMDPADSIRGQNPLGKIPALILDPKGDMTNLLLTFPDLAPADFRPWVDEAAANREGKDPEAVAADTARLWSSGLESWGLGGPDIAALRRAAEFTIFTPGSEAGVPLNVIGSLRAPTSMDDAEAVREMSDMQRRKFEGDWRVNNVDMNQKLGELQILSKELENVSEVVYYGRRFFSNRVVQVTVGASIVVILLGIFGVFGMLYNLAKAFIEKIDEIKKLK